MPRICSKKRWQIDKTLFSCRILLALYYFIYNPMKHCSRKVLVLMKLHSLKLCQAQDFMGQEDSVKMRKVIV